MLSLVNLTVRKWIASLVLCFWYASTRLSWRQHSSCSYCCSLQKHTIYQNSPELNLMHLREALSSLVTFPIFLSKCPVFAHQLSVKRPYGCHRAHRYTYPSSSGSRRSWYVLELTVRFCGLSYHLNSTLAPQYCCGSCFAYWCSHWSPSLARESPNSYFDLWAWVSRWRDQSIAGVRFASLWSGWVRGVASIIVSFGRLVRYLKLDFSNRDKAWNQMPSIIH